MPTLPRFAPAPKKQEKPPPAEQFKPLCVEKSVNDLQVHNTG
jgi:hypothetical protein